MRHLTLLRAMLLSALLSATPAKADDAELSYEERLTRLAEVLGSIHFLYGLCNKEEGAWREQMVSLLESEASSSENFRSQLISNFNHGYRSFATTYSRCTDSARQAIKLYMEEGEELTSGIVQHYGQ